MQPQDQRPYHVRLAEYEQRKREIRRENLSPEHYDKAIDALCEELGLGE